MYHFHITSRVKVYHFTLTFESTRGVPFSSSQFSSLCPLIFNKVCGRTLTLSLPTAPVYHILREHIPQRMFMTRKLEWKFD